MKKVCVLFTALVMAVVSAVIFSSCSHDVDLDVTVQDKKITMPCKMSDLPDYTFNKELTSSCANGMISICFTSQEYNTLDNAGYLIVDEKSFDDIKPDTVVHAVSYSGYRVPCDMKVNGLTTLCSFDDVKNKFGKPEKTNNEKIKMYCDGDMRVSFFVGKGEKVYTITAFDKESGLVE